MGKLLDQLRKGADLNLDERVRLAILELEDRVHALEPCSGSVSGAHLWHAGACCNCDVKKDG
jgi:hypothetical protein